MNQDQTLSFLQSVSLATSRLLVALIGLIPFGVRSVFGRLIGQLIGCIPFRDRQVALLQIHHFLKHDKPEQLTRRVFGSVVQTLLESLNLKPVLENPDKYVSCPDLGYVKELVRQERPIVALTAHTGNWDLLAAYMVLQGVPLSVVGREARNPVLHRVLEEIRASYGVKTLWRGSSGSKEVLRDLGKNRTVAALIDQDTAVASEFSSFFGSPAKSPSALIALAKKKQAILVTAFISRTRLNSYTVHVQALDSELGIVEILDEYHRRLEDLIRRHPEQWVWFHKRWRSLPGGEHMRTKQYIDFLRKARS